MRNPSPFHGHEIDNVLIALFFLTSIEVKSLIVIAPKVVVPSDTLLVLFITLFLLIPTPRGEHRKVLGCVGRG